MPASQTSEQVAGARGCVRAYTELYDRTLRAVSVRMLPQVGPRPGDAPEAWHCDDRWKTSKCTIVHCVRYAPSVTEASAPQASPAAPASPRDYFAGDPRSNHERMLAGDLYIADDPAIFERQQQAARLSARFLAAYSEDGFAAQEIARELFGDLDETAFVRPPVYVDYGSHTTIGARTFINSGLTALDVAPITIGEDCPLSRSRAGTSWRRPNRSRSVTTSGSAAASSSFPAPPSATTR